MRVPAVSVVLLVTLLAGCSEEGTPPVGPLARIDVDVFAGDTTRIVAGIYNIGDQPMALDPGCADWTFRAIGPLGALDLPPAPCDVPTTIPVGGSASRTWDWTVRRVHVSVGGVHDVVELPLDGTYRFEVAFRAPQGPIVDSVSRVQDAVPREAVAGEGPGTLGWRVWAWDGNAALENRGERAAPVVWSPCGVGLWATAPDGRLLPRPRCELGHTVFELQPGRLLVAPVDGAGAAALLEAPGGTPAEVVALWDGPDSGRAWFTGAWHGRTGPPTVLARNTTFQVHDPARPGAYLTGSTDARDAWVAVRNDGARTYRVAVGCGLPWEDPQPGCTPNATVWLAPGEDLSRQGPPPDGSTYRFRWGPDSDVLAYTLPQEPRADA